MPQDPNDEPASVLLECIRAEKATMIKAGRIKKEKNPSAIFRSVDNLPYGKVGNREVSCIYDEDIDKLQNVSKAKVTVSLEVHADFDGRSM